MTIDDLFALGVAYEMWAIVTKRTPSITRLCRRNKWLAVPVLVVSAAHLLRKVEESL